MHHVSLALITHEVFGVGKEDVPTHSHNVNVHHPIDRRHVKKIDELRRWPYRTVGLN
jgi:hypothetical protein